MRDRVITFVPGIPFFRLIDRLIRTNILSEKGISGRMLVRMIRVFRIPRDQNSYKARSNIQGRARERGPHLLPGRCAAARKLAAELRTMQVWIMGRCGLRLCLLPVWCAVCPPFSTALCSELAADGRGLARVAPRSALLCAAPADTCAHTQSCKPGPLFAGRRQR